MMGLSSSSVAKDAQVKILGQRVELGEVEQHVRSKLGKQYRCQVLAETFVPSGSKEPILACFLSTEKQNGLDKAVAAVVETLYVLLPAYMVPSAFIPMEDIPMTATNKQTGGRCVRSASPSR